MVSKSSEQTCLSLRLGAALIACLLHAAISAPNYAQTIPTRTISNTAPIACTIQITCALQTTPTDTSANTTITATLIPATPSVVASPTVATPTPPSSAPTKSTDSTLRTTEALLVTASASALPGTPTSIVQDPTAESPDVQSTSTVSASNGSATTLTVTTTATVPSAPTEPTDLILNASVTPIGTALALPVPSTSTATGQVATATISSTNQQVDQSFTRAVQIESDNRRLEASLDFAAKVLSSIAVIAVAAIPFILGGGIKAAGDPNQRNVLVLVFSVIAIVLGTIFFTNLFTQSNRTLVVTSVGVSDPYADVQSRVNALQSQVSELDKHLSRTNSEVEALQFESDAIRSTLVPWLQRSNEITLSAEVTRSRPFSNNITLDQYNALASQVKQMSVDLATVKDALQPGSGLETQEESSMLLQMFSALVIALAIAVFALVVVIVFVMLGQRTQIHRLQDENQKVIRASAAHDVEKEFKEKLRSLEEQLNSLKQENTTLKTKIDGGDGPSESKPPPT